MKRSLATLFLALWAMTLTLSTPPSLAQTELHPQSQPGHPDPPPANPDAVGKAKEPGGFSIWWIIIPVVIVAFVVIFIGISTSPERNPSKSPK